MSLPAVPSGASAPPALATLPGYPLSPPHPRPGSALRDVPPPPPPRRSSWSCPPLPGFPCPPPETSPAPSPPPPRFPESPPAAPRCLNLALRARVGERPPPSGQGAAESPARLEGCGLRGHHATRGGGRSPGRAGARLSLPRGRSPEAIAAAARAGEVRCPRGPAARVSAGIEAGCSGARCPGTRAQARSRR